VDPEEEADPWPCVDAEEEDGGGLPPNLKPPPSCERGGGAGIKVDDLGVGRVWLEGLPIGREDTGASISCAPSSAIDGTVVAPGLGKNMDRFLE
jgi:hypothetical protein